MKLIPAKTVEEIALMLQAEFVGDANLEITGINELHRVEPGDLTFADHPKYYKKVMQSQASVIIIDKKTEVPDGKALIFSEKPFASYNFLARHFLPFKKTDQQVSVTAEIGENTIIQPGVFIGNHAKIGNNCLIHPNVSIYDHTVIGNNVIIHANSVIGSDAFYFHKENNGYAKMHSSGKTIIHDHVEIGASCTIDRGVSAVTEIGQGTKFDNQVHIGHDVIIGKNCLFAAQVAIAGMVTIKDNVILWGQVGINKDLTIGEGAVVLAQSGIGRDIAPNTTHFGSPASEARQKMKEIAAMKDLPELMRKWRS